VLFFALSLFCGLTIAQTYSTELSTVVPQLVNFSGKAVDAQGYECWATHAAGVRSGRRWIGRSANPERTSAKQPRTGSFNLRQLSTTERIAATLGPACGLPMYIQFFRPRVDGKQLVHPRHDRSGNGVSGI
jgi:hypothetical protein